MSSKTIEALEFAIKAESESRARYEKMAKEAEDPETRLICEQFAREENNHYKVLSNRLKALKLLG